jgi:hypothetical protein
MNLDKCLSRFITRIAFFLDGGSNAIFMSFAKVQTPLQTIHLELQELR